MFRVGCVLLALLFPVAAKAQTQATVKTYQSKFTVEETTSRLEKILADKGVTLAAKIDHGAAAGKAGIGLPPTVLMVFGNPKLGSPLMQTNPRIGLDLPMRMLVWQDGSGKVWLGYTPPSTLQARFSMHDKGSDATFKTMAGALDAFAKFASGANE